MLISAPSHLLLYSPHRCLITKRRTSPPVPQITCARQMKVKPTRTTARAAAEAGLNANFRLCASGYLFVCAFLFCFRFNAAQLKEVLQMIEKQAGFLIDGRRKADLDAMSEDEAELVR
jgi:hypothetical protein